MAIVQRNSASHGGGINLDDQASTFDSAEIAQVVRRLTQGGGADAQSTLKRWLSINSKAATPFAIELRDSRPLAQFHSIGKGCCAEVFEFVGTGYVYKRAYTPHDLQLWADYVYHTAVYRDVRLAFESLPLQLCVPEVFCYISNQDEDWWTEHRGKWPTAAFNEPTDLLKAELIKPLPLTVRKALIEQFCPSEQKENALENPANRDCLIRVYLGRRRKFTSIEDIFTLRNFHMDLGTMDTLELGDQEKESHARSMAAALAIMHWTSKTDAADVEFVLGSAPANLHPPGFDPKNLQPRTSTLSEKAICLWLLDFNQCTSMSMNPNGVAKAVGAFWRNDPYYPRPVFTEHAESAKDAQLWENFAAEYLKQSAFVAEESVTEMGLPQQFIEGIVAEAKKRSSVASGPPKGMEEGPGTVGDGSARRGRGRKGRGAHRENRLDSIMFEAL